MDSWICGAVGWNNLCIPEEIMILSRVDNLLPRLTRSGVRESTRTPIPPGAGAVSVHVKMDPLQKLDPARSFSLNVWVLTQGERHYCGGQTWRGGPTLDKDGVPDDRDPVLRVGPLTRFAGRGEAWIVLDAPCALDCSCDLIFDDQPR